MDNQLISVIREAVASEMKKTVNGKIDDLRKIVISHNTVHEEQMKRVIPVVEAFEESQHDLKTAKKLGKFALGSAATVTALGGAYLVLRQIFFRW